jgi:transcriptional regulator with XRE-family HTH domain
LRQTRERAGISLRGLARAAGVSPSLISQVENGRVMPSVGTLYAIANELGLQVDELFRDTEAALAKPDPGQAIKPAAQTSVQLRKGRKTIRLASGVCWERLTPQPDEELDFLFVVYDVGGESCAPDSLIRHGGKEYAIVLNGRLGVQLGFDEYDLGPGDSIVFDAQTPHRLWTIGNKPAQAVWVVLNRHSDTRSAKPSRRAR